MESIEIEGKTVAEAVEGALAKIGLRRDQVEVQIIQEASSGFLGIGAKPAKVRVTEKLWGEPAAAGTNAKPAPARKPIQPAPRTEQPARPAQAARAPAPRHAPAKEKEREPSPPSVDPKAACARAEEALGELLRLMKLDGVTIKASFDAQQERVKAAADGPEAERLVGQEGRTLEAVQFLATLIVGRRVGAPVAVLVDVQGFWEKKEQEILAQAKRGVEEVRSSGKPFRLPPMEAPMRRLIHRNLAGHPDVETASEGEGSWRKIVIRPRKG